MSRNRLIIIAIVVVIVITGAVLSIPGVVRDTIGDRDAAVAAGRAAFSKKFGMTDLSAVTFDAYEQDNTWIVHTVSAEGGSGEVYVQFDRKSGEVLDYGQR